MDRSNIPSLDDLRAFEAVARLGSVRAAADELSLTHGAVSRRVTKLARDIGVSLVTPQGRGIVVTPHGETLATATTKALALVGEALNTLHSTDADAPVVLSCERSVAMRWLIPRLSQFQDSHPEVPVHMSVGGGPLDFARDRVALAVRRLDFPIDPDWNVQNLCEEENGPVMVPDMVKSFQAGGYIGLGSKSRPDAWSTWMHHNPEAPKPGEIRLYDHHFLLAEAAANGLGVAVCPRIVVCDDIDRGRLIAPLGFVKDGSSYGLIQLRHPELNAGAKVLARWLSSAFSSIYE